MRNDTTWALLIPPCVQDMILRSDNQKSWMRQLCSPGRDSTVTPTQGKEPGLLFETFA